MKKKSARPVSASKFIKPTLIISFILIYLFASFFFKVFTVKTIHCNKGGESCEEPIIAELNRLQGSFFFSPAISNTVDKIIRSDPYISEIKVERTFPHTISFLLQKKNPLAEIHCEQMNLLVNTDSKVEENTRNVRLDVPIISADQTLCDFFLNQGYIDINDLSALMSFSQVVAKSTPDLTVEWSDQSTVVVQTPTQQKIILPHNQLESTFQTYQYLLDQNQLTEGWTELDLRFQKAIVKTE